MADPGPPSPPRSAVKPRALPLPPNRAMVAPRINAPGRARHALSAASPSPPAEAPPDETSPPD